MFNIILKPGKLLKGPTEQHPSKITGPQSNKVIKTQKSKNSKEKINNFIKDHLDYNQDVDLDDTVPNHWTNPNESCERTPKDIWWIQDNLEERVHEK
jgi:hypothetical protein